ncbi:hypothetical protein FALCPG4_004026 [Fusarium falciforme]
MSTTNGSVDGGEVIACTIKLLPRSEWGSEAATAISNNPANAPVDQRALLTTRYWGSSGVRLSVGFLDNPPVDLRDRILSHMSAWGKYAKVQFLNTASGYVGDIRIARKALGFPHERMTSVAVSIAKKAMAYFMSVQGLTRKG